MMRPIRLVFVLTIFFSLLCSINSYAKELEQVIIDYKTGTVLSGTVKSDAVLRLNEILYKCVSDMPSPTEFELYSKIDQYGKAYFPSAKTKIVGTERAFLQLQLVDRTIFIFYHAKSSIQSVVITVQDNQTLPKASVLLTTINNIDRQMKYFTLATKDEMLQPVQVNYSKSSVLWTKTGETLIVIVPSAFREEDLETHIVLSPRFHAPIAKDAVLGYIEYAYAEQPLGKVAIISAGEAKRFFANVPTQSPAEKLPSDLIFANNKEAVNQAFHFGFLYVNDDGNFRPTENCTTADAIIMFMHVYIQLYGDLPIFYDTIKKYSDGANVIQTDQRYLLKAISNGFYKPSGNTLSLEADMTYAQFASLVSSLVGMNPVKQGYITREEVVAFLCQYLIQAKLKTPPPALTQGQIVLSQIASSEVVAAFVVDTVLYKSNSAKSNRILSIKKDTRCEILEDRDAVWYYVKVDGVTGWVLGETLSIPSDKPTNPHLMQQSDAEFFVNQGNFESKTAYLCWVDIDRQYVMIFKGSKHNWQLFDSFPCSTGRNATPTIRGTYQLSDRGASFTSKQYGVVAKYWTRIKGNYLFHSILYAKDGSIADSILGEKRSHGCIRVATDKAEWIHKNLKANTTVYIN